MLHRNQDTLRHLVTFLRLPLMMLRYLVTLIVVSYMIYKVYILQDNRHFLQELILLLG